MAVRKTTKTRSRLKQAPKPKGTIAIVLPNGDSATAAVVKNGSFPSFEQIQRRAYELFVARGATHGCDWDDWFTAEQELTAGSIGAG
jgi:DUF2934 family protein